MGRGLWLHRHIALTSRGVHQHRPPDCYPVCTSIVHPIVTLYVPASSTRLLPCDMYQHRPPDCYPVCTSIIHPIVTLCAPWPASLGRQSFVSPLCVSTSFSHNLAGSNSNLNVAQDVGGTFGGSPQALTF